jgi:hypothetical protein
VSEETGLQVTPGRLIGAVERPRPGGQVLVIRDYAATVTGGDLAAGDDAAEARWVSPRDLDDLPLTSGLKEALNAWGVLAPVPAPAVVAEATRRAGLVWLTVPAHPGPFPVWHIWRTVTGTEPGAPGPPPPGALYLVTGPGEQPAPGLGTARQVTVTVPSKESGGALVTWTASVRTVNPGSTEWDAIIGPLVAGRLNAALGPGEASPEGRWARSGTVFCLTPVWFPG